MGNNSIADIIGLSSILHSFSRCCLPKSRNQAKFRQNLALQQFKVIQGHRSWCQSKAHMRRNPLECCDEIWQQKLESWGYQRRNHDASFIRFDTIPACDRQTDRWRDGRTDTL